MPSVNVVDSYWIRYENRTYLNKGAGPMQQMLKSMANNVATGDKEWSVMFGADRTKWPFNTGCCCTDTYFQMAPCKAA